MTISTRFTATAVYVGLLAATALVGCGGSQHSMAKVEGEVKFDGKPIEKGNILFLPSDGKGPTAGGDIANGRFSVLVAPGPKRIEVHWPKVVGKRKQFDTPDSPTLDVVEELIPLAYNVRSTLTENIEAPQTRVDLDLKAAAPRAKP